MARRARRPHRGRVLVGAAALSALAAVSAPVAARAEPSGLTVLPTRITEVPPVTEEVAGALDDAWTLSERHPADLGYPWVDRRSGTVVLDAVTPAGLATAAAFVPARGAAVPRRVRRVVASRAELDRIQQDAIALTDADVPDGHLVYVASPDPEHDRVLVTVERRSEPLLRALARRYGTRAVAVRVDPNRGSLMANRQQDISPYYGGAKIEDQNGASCTAGFSWYNANYVMITAGHCAPNGGWIYSGTASIDTYMGNVRSGYRESWTDGTGTVYMTGQTTYHGDLAYILLDKGGATWPYIYRGGPTSSSSAVVKEMLNRRAIIGDKPCFGGYVSGEQCGWYVGEISASYRYTNGETVRPAVMAFRYGSCSQHGDSGAPVYTVRTDGGITARGILSGGTHSSTATNCAMVFTDIWEADAGFPGALRTGV